LKEEAIAQHIRNCIAAYSVHRCMQFCKPFWEPRVSVFQTRDAPKVLLSLAVLSGALVCPANRNGSNKKRKAIRMLQFGCCSLLCPRRSALGKETPCSLCEGERQPKAKGKVLFVLVSFGRK